MAQKQEVHELDTSFVSTIVVRLQFKDVFLRTWTREELIERLNRCPLSIVLDYIGRASAILFKDGGRNLDTQRQLCEVFFGALASRVWIAFEKGISENADSKGLQLVVLFDEATVALTAKMALLHSPALPAATGIDVASLGEAMLMINKLVDAQAPIELKRSTPEGRDARAYYVYVVSAFQPREDELHAFARTAELLLRDQPQLHGTPNYIDLPARVKVATDLDSSTLWSILFAYFTHFSTISASDAHERNAFIDSGNYFDAYKFSESDVRSFLRVVAQPHDQAIAELRRKHSISTVRPYDNFAIARAPLIEIDNRAYCPVVRFLFERVTSGLYHVLLNATPGSTVEDIASRERFQRYLGDVFEDYVDRLVRRVLDVRRANGRPVPLYLGPAELRASVAPSKKGFQSPICDHLIWDGTSAVIWDSKAKFLPLEARVGENIRTFIKRFGELVDGAAGQLHATAERIRSGAFAQYGIDPSKVQHIFPAMVSLADYAIQPHLQVWIEGRVRSQAFLTNGLSHPFEVLMCSDLEKLESPWAEGREIADILLTKRKSQIWRQHSMHNFIAMGGNLDIQHSRSAHLVKMFEQLTDSAESFFAANLRAVEAE